MLSWKHDDARQAMRSNYTLRPLLRKWLGDKKNLRINAVEVEWCGAVSKSKEEIYKGKENVSDTREYKGKAEE